MITGESPDANRDYELYKQIPKFEEKLQGFYDDLTNISTLSHYSGFGNTISINGDKVYLDCDDLFYALIEHSANDVEARQLYNILLEYYLNVSDIIDKLHKGLITDKEADKSLGELITKDIAAKILNNKYVKDILTEKVYKIYDENNKTDIEKARIIARSISSILFYGQHFDESDPTNKGVNTMSIDKKTMRDRYENWKQKVYNFFVNGKNGNVTGKTPISPLKVGILVLLGVAVVVGAILLGYYCCG